MADVSVWATSPLEVRVRCIFCGFFFFFSSSQLRCPLRFQNSPQTHSWEGFLLFGNFSFITTPSSGQVSVLNSFDSFFVFYILPYLLSKRMCCLSGCLVTSANIQKFFFFFLEVSQHSNDLLMILWGRKCSPHSIPPPSCLSFLGLLDIVCLPLPEGSDYYLVVIPHNFPDKSMRKVRGWP